MSILDKAKERLAREKKNAANESLANSRAYNYKQEQIKNRARVFIGELGLSKPFKVKLEDKTVLIYKSGKEVVRITFGQNTRSEYRNGEYDGESEPFDEDWIVYSEDFKPYNSQSYQHIKGGQRTRFVHYDGCNDMEFLGEYLLQI